MTKFSPEQINEWHEHALEINKLVDEILAHGEQGITAQKAAEYVTAEKKYEHLEKETEKDFGRGWGEEMQRQLIALHPAVRKVEAAPKFSDREQKTDAFVDFEKGKIGVQLTLNGHGRHGSEELNKKFNDLLKAQFGNVTYYGKKEVPLTMSSGILGEFLDIYKEWKNQGAKGSPIDLMDKKRREDLTNHFIFSMSKVFEWKYFKLGKKEFKEWADYLKDIYEKREAELKKERAAPWKRDR